MSADRNVPCNGCTACCRYDTIHLEPDELARFAGRWHMELIPELGVERPVLDRRSDGSCVFVTARGCSVHDHAPAACRSFDCRALYARTPKAVRREWIAQLPSMRAVFDAGKKRATAVGEAR